MIDIIIDIEVLPAERRPDARPNYRALDMIRQPALNGRVPRMIGEGME